MNTRNKIFENFNYVCSLTNNRNISPESIDSICKIICDLFPLDNKVNNSFIDICCGTGRFSIPIAKSCQGIKITGLDNSENMLVSLKNKIRKGNITNYTIIHEDFLKWKSKSSYHVVFMSAAIHLFNSKQDVFYKIQSIQESGGYFILRTPFREQLKQSEIYKRMPEALEIYEKSHPSKKELYDYARLADYKIINIHKFLEKNILKRRHFLDLFYKKMHSAFWQIDEAIYKKRLTEIEISTMNQKKIECPMETSVIIFEKI